MDDNISMRELRLVILDGDGLIIFGVLGRLELLFFVLLRGRILNRAGHML